jgi:hypothetical protein
LPPLATALATASVRWLKGPCNDDHLAWDLYPLVYLSAPRPLTMQEDPRGVIERALRMSLHAGGRDPRPTGLLEWVTSGWQAGVGLCGSGGGVACGGELAEGVGDLGVAVVGGVLVAQGGLGGGVAEAVHEFGEGGAGVGGEDGAGVA